MKEIVPQVTLQPNLVGLPLAVHTLLTEKMKILLRMNIHGSYSLIIDLRQVPDY